MVGGNLKLENELSNRAICGEWQKKNCSKNAWKMFAIMGKGKIKEAIPNITARRMVKNG